MTPLNDDDDFMLINGKKVLKDGRSIKVPMTFMDNKTVMADGALHRPGPRPVADTKSTEAKASAYDAMVHDLSDAWRKPLPEEEKKALPTADARESAYDGMVRGVENAWRGA
jgi:hypothetical protein